MQTPATAMFRRAKRRRRAERNADCSVDAAVDQVHAASPPQLIRVIDGSTLREKRRGKRPQARQARTSPRL
ncbi:MAG: hypothetical protein KDA61_05015, partial [Planctomycetales bacterium]|nr:hypothetical protein [Planctomycetales bacterium]